MTRQRNMRALILLAALVSPAFAQAGPKPDTAALDIKLSTNGNDIAFSQTAIQVPFGKKVKIRFVNQASKDSEILHNIAILRPDATDSVIKELQATGYDMEKMR